MRRGINNFTEEEIKARIKYDGDFYIGKTTFKVVYSMSDYDAMLCVEDPQDSGKVILNGVRAKGYRRKAYLTTSNDLFDIIRRLSKKAYILFKYIIDEVTPNSNKIKISTKDIAQIINSNDQPVISKTLNELIKAGLIHKAIDGDYKDVYIINHNEFYKGSYNNFIYKYGRLYRDTKKKDIKDIEDE